RAEPVGTLVPVSVVALVAEVGGLVGGDLLRPRLRARVLLDRAEPAIHRDQAGEVALGVADDRRWALPDQLAVVVAVLAIEVRAYRERPVGVVEGTGVGTAAVDDR